MSSLMENASLTVGSEDLVCKNDLSILVKSEATLIAKDKVTVLSSYIVVDVSVSKLSLLQATTPAMTRAKNNSFVVFILFLFNSVMF